MSNYIVKFNTDGSINETIGSNIFQYSTGANVVEIQIDKPQNSVVTISIVRADAVALSAKPCVAKLGEPNAWVYTLSNTDLSVDGDLDFSFTISYNGVDLNTEAVHGTVQVSYNNGYVAVDPTMTEEILQALANLQVDKVGRYDVLDLPVDITYSADGLKSTNNLFYNAQFTINTNVVIGTLLITSFLTGSVVTQQEILFSSDNIFRRVLTINGGTIAVGEWANLNDLFAEVSTLQTIAKKVDIYPTTNEHIVDNMFEYDIIVPNNITLSDIQTNGLNLMLTNGSAFNNPNYKKIVIKNENGDYIIDTYLNIWFGSGYTSLLSANPIGCLMHNDVILHYLLRYDIDIPSDSFFVTYDEPYGTADLTHDGLLRNIDFAKIQNALLKTAQTLTSYEKTQAKTNLDLQNVDNTSDLNKPISTATLSALNDKINLTEKAVANGVATLDSTGKIPSDQLPPIAITNTFVVNSQVEMLALDAQVGDIAVRTDLNQSFILQTADPSILGHWQVLLMPTDTVLSVAGKTGIVTLNKNDVGLNNVDNTSDLNKPISTAMQTALNDKTTRLTFANTTVQTTDFIADTTYSDFGFKATVALSGVLATDNADLYFDGATINTAITDSNAFMTESYAGGIYLYSKVVPSATVTISTIEIRR